MQASCSSHDHERSNERGDDERGGKRKEEQGGDDHIDEGEEECENEHNDEEMINLHAHEELLFKLDQRGVVEELLDVSEIRNIESVALGAVIMTTPEMVLGFLQSENNNGTFRRNSLFQYEEGKSVVTWRIYEGRKVIEVRPCGELQCLKFKYQS